MIFPNFSSYTAWITIKYRLIYLILYSWVILVINRQPMSSYVYIKQIGKKVPNKI